MPEMAGPESAVPTGKTNSMLEIHIVEQIEYYFGDFNMMKDKFLKQEVSKNDGWVPITTLLRFNRLAALTKSVDEILSAFKNNPSSIVEVNDETKSVRRNPERTIPEQGDSWRNTVAERSIYVKGFPVDSTTLDDILKFMTTFGKIDNVFKRSYYDKALKQWKFKGSVYVAFPTKEDAESFMSIGSVKFNGNELIRKWQNDYIEDKKNERMKLKLEAKETKNQLLKEQQEGLVKDMKKLPEGALIALSGLDKKIGLNELKTAVTELGWDVNFVEYNMGESTAYVRLQIKNSAKDALAKLTDSSFEMKGVTVKAQLVEGEEETKLLEKMEADRKSRIMQQMLKSKGKKGKGKKNKFVRQTRNGDPAGCKKEKEEEMDVNIKTEEQGSNEALTKVEAENGEVAGSEKVENSNAEPGTSDQSSIGVLKRKSDDENNEENATKKKSKSDEK